MSTSSRSQSLQRRVTPVVAILVALSVPVRAQEPVSPPAKARRDAPVVDSTTVMFEGSIVELQGAKPAGKDDPVVSVAVKRGTTIRKFVVRLTGTPAEPKTSVLRGLDELDTGKVKNALKSPGRHVIVTHMRTPLDGLDSFAATRVLLGFAELVGGTASLAELAVIDKVLGNGAVAESGKVVTVNYTGWLADGTMFDSSFLSGSPIEVRVGKGEVIKGWDLGIPGMRVGGRRRLLIPSRLGYGVRGAGNDIPSNAVLVFDIELVGVR